MSGPHDTAPPAPIGWRGVPADRVAGAFCCVAAGVLVWQSLRLPLGSLHNPGAGYVPLLLAAGIGLSGALLVLWPGRGVGMGNVEWSEGRHALAILGVCGASALLLERVGWRITCFLLMAFLLGLVERRGWRLTLLLSLALALGTYYLFATLLRVPLPAEPFRW
ncbi:MAG TPA: tripartite tricarboxylate transporter TctB family protein [bacterium]